MKLEQITPVILTYNESSNIERSLKQLFWAKTIVVIDSYSEDETLKILSDYKQVQLFQRIFDNHTNQWNYGIEKVTTKWVLSLDADYILSDRLIERIKNIPIDTNIDGYFIPFKYCVFGKPLRGTLLPSRQALFRKEKAIYINDGHTQLLKLDGKSGKLSSHIYHDDRKSLNRWLWSQDRYMIIEVKKLLDTPLNELSWADRIRRHKIIAPFIILVYCLIIKGGIFDGWAGFYYAFQRTLAEIILSLRLIELEFNDISVDKNIN